MYLHGMWSNDMQTQARKLGCMRGLATDLPLASRHELFLHKLYPILRLSLFDCTGYADAREQYRDLSRVTPSLLKLFSSHDLKPL